MGGIFTAHCCTGLPQSSTLGGGGPAGGKGLCKGATAGGGGLYKGATGLIEAAAMAGPSGNGHAGGTKSALPPILPASGGVDKCGSIMPPTRLVGGGAARGGGSALYGVWTLGGGADPADGRLGGKGLIESSMSGGGAPGGGGGGGARWLRIGGACHDEIAGGIATGTEGGNGHAGSADRAAGECTGDTGGSILPLKTSMVPSRWLKRRPLSRRRRVCWKMGRQRASS